MRNMILAAIGFVFGVHAFADTQVPVVKWEVGSGWNCETEEDAKQYPNGFKINQPAIELVSCKDETGLCLTFNSPVTFYQCVRKSEAKYHVVRVSRNGRMVVQVLPYEAYKNHKLALRGTENPETGFSDWTYVSLADHGRQLVSDTTGVNFGLGITEALALNNIDKNKAAGIVRINAKWHWLSACTQNLDFLPCPDISAGYGTDYYISPGYFDMDIDVNLNQLGPVQVKSFQYHAN